TLDILCINKFGPYSNAITGMNAAEILDYLHEKGFNVGFLCMNAVYRATIGVQCHPKAYPVWQMRTLFDSDRKNLRLFLCLLNGLLLFLKSKRIRHRTVIVMTDPPLLFLWFQLFRHSPRIRLGYFAMDVFPDAFVAGKYIKPNNVFYRIIEKIVYSRPPDFLISLGSGQRNFLMSKFRSKPVSIITTSGLTPAIPQCLYRKVPSERISFGYLGNLGEAHDEHFVMQFIESLNPRKHIMYLNVYGTKSKILLSAIKHNPAVVVCDAVPLNDFCSIDISVVSLLSGWKHICIPSKAITSIFCGCAVLLNVSSDSDLWSKLSEAGWHIPPGDNYHDAINQFLSDLDHHEIIAKRKAALRIARCFQRIKKKSFKTFASLLRNSYTDSSCR
ncbi:hypothetical protein JW979_09010, partial [bacterium]|nr:hypothetical protein [candidate division CSSED10-310 bacterium]